jgi:hypothetical protein
MADSKPVATHHVEESVQETETGLIKFTTVTGKQIITNMDFICFEEQNGE